MYKKMSNKSATTESKIELFCQQLAEILVEQVRAQEREDDNGKGQSEHNTQALRK